jgi:hypothetical protein
MIKVMDMPSLTEWCAENTITGLCQSSINTQRIRGALCQSKGSASWAAIWLASVLSSLLWMGFENGGQGFSERSFFDPAAEFGGHHKVYLAGLIEYPEQLFGGSEVSVG